MSVGRLPDVETFWKLQRFLESRLRAQEREGKVADLLADPAAREALAKYELFKKKPILFVPQRYSK